MLRKHQPHQPEPLLQAQSASALPVPTPHSKDVQHKRSDVIRTIILSTLVFGVASLAFESYKLTPSIGIPSLDSIRRSYVFQRQAPRPLPDFSRGGVVLFYHVPKTGGTSIRHNMAELPHVREQFLGSTLDMLDYQLEIELALTAQNSKDILFLELHGPLPGMFDMWPYLERWRLMADQYKTAFFSFALVREPISYAVSYFNFFWSAPCTFNGCPYKLYEPTEENLLLTSKPDIQCLYLGRDVTWVSFTDNQTVIPQATAMECAAINEILLDQFDWVGTTEGLSTETMPLLTQLLAGDANLASTMPQHNKMEITQDVIVKKDELRPDTIAELRFLYANDQTIYDSVRQSFTLDMWTDFPRDFRP